jgi:hypothetical protein
MNDVDVAMRRRVVMVTGGKITIFEDKAVRRTLE